MNDVAGAVTKKEKGKKSVIIGNTREVFAELGVVMAGAPALERSRIVAGLVQVGDERIKQRAWAAKRAHAQSLVKFSKTPPKAALKELAKKPSKKKAKAKSPKKAAKKAVKKRKK
jgi:hypothetical protein